MAESEGAEGNRMGASPGCHQERIRGMNLLDCLLYA
jgi:hypothetical protein